MLGSPSAVPIQVAVVGGGLLIVLAIVLGLTYFRSVTGSSGDSPGEEGTVDVPVEVIDESTDRTYPHADRVVARPEPVPGRGQKRINTTDSIRIDLTAGEGEAELAHGTWVFEIEQNGETIGRRRHELEYGFETDHLGLSVEPHVVEAVVTGGPDREPLAGATIEATADVDAWGQRTPTDSEGRARFEVPRSASTVTFAAEHGDLPAVESEHRVEEAVEEGVTIAIGSGAGGITVETVVGDRAWPEVDVRITPVSETATSYTDEGTITTKRDGQRTIEGLPAGEYEISADPQVESVDTTAATESVTVVDDETTEVTLSVGVSYSLDGAQRERLAALRERIGALADHPGRDTAIPQYYGTVLLSILDMVEEVDSAPARAVEPGVSPDAVVGAVLDATDAGVDAVADAMSDRRVVSLFTACEPMSPVQVAWGTDPAVGAFLDRVRLGGTRRRQTLHDRLEETDDFLTRRWSEVNDDAPVRKLYDRLGEFARETDDLDDELVVVARTVVGVCLLDAIEELFDHDALVERLNGRTL